ncbi:hypothetical protein [Billgrantia antri]|uniref:hypothetical protein n=1 Tax=Billgrantia antri TaxID=2846777 RepID=UPI003B219FAC
MGWRGLVDDLLDGGMLVGLHELMLRSTQGYGLIVARPDSPGEAKRALQEWALECAAAGC